MDDTLQDFAAAGARLIEEDERTFTDMDHRLGRLRSANSTQSNNCEAIMAELKAKQEERKKPWRSRVYLWFSLRVSRRLRWR